MDDISDSFLSWEFWTVSLCMVLFSSLASGIGIGGGVLNVPLILLILQVNAKQSIALSKATILGVAIGGLLVNVRRSHPLFPERPLIYYDAALVLCPQILLGSLLGIFANVILPDYIILAFILVLLGFVGFKTAKNAYEQWKMEYGKNILDYKKIDNQQEKEESVHKNLLHLSKYKHQMYPWFKYFYFFIMLVILLIIILIGGGSDASVIGIECGSLLYWMIYLLAVPAMGGFTIFSGLRLYKNEKKYESFNMDPEAQKGIYLRYGITWNLKNLILWPLVSIFAGFSAALIGIGGGSIQAPILLEMGLSPQVAAVTSAFMISFTATSNVVQYFLLGLLHWQHALWYGALGLVGAVIGHNTVAYIVDRWKKQFFITFMLLILLSVSCIILVYQIVGGFVTGDVDYNFSPLCKSKSPENYTESYYGFA